MTTWSSFSPKTWSKKMQSWLHSTITTRRWNSLPAVWWLNLIRARNIGQL
jgi:hypothetical protein